MCSSEVTSYSEIETFVKTNISPERLLVFPCLILQKDLKVFTGRIIKDMIDNRLDLWQQYQFDTLLRMFLRCKKGRGHSSQPTSTDDENANIFAWTIRDGNVRGVLSVLTQKSGKPLEPHRFTTSKYGDAPVNVLDVRGKHRGKHPVENIPEKLLRMLLLLIWKRFPFPTQSWNVSLGKHLAAEV